MSYSKTLLLPNLPPGQCQRIAEGRLGLVIPGRLADRQLLAASVLMRQQRHQREETQQGWRGAQDRQVRPLALSLYAQMLADLMVGDFNGLITNDKFCLSRPGRLMLSWSRRPRRPRQSDAQADYPPNDIAHCGGPHETTLARAPAFDSEPRRTTSLGSGLPIPSAMEPGRPDPAGGVP